MTLGLRAGFRSYPIGRVSLLYALFSTIAVRLEGNDWGSHYPVIMKQLYNGWIEADEVSQGLVELNEIVRQLRYFEAADIVWDYEDRKKKPTATYRKHISGLRLDECFITVRKENLLSVMVDACEYAIAIHRAVEIDELDYSFWAGN